MVVNVCWSAVGEMVIAFWHEESFTVNRTLSRPVTNSFH